MRSVLLTAPSILPSASLLVPSLIGEAGEHASKRFIEFFTANIRNPNSVDLDLRLTLAAGAILRSFDAPISAIRRNAFILRVLDKLVASRWANTNTIRRLQGMIPQLIGAQRLKAKEAQKTIQAWLATRDSFGA